MNFLNQMKNTEDNQIMFTCESYCGIFLVGNNVHFSSSKLYFITLIEIYFCFMEKKNVITFNLQYIFFCNNKRYPSLVVTIKEHCKYDHIKFILTRNRNIFFRLLKGDNSSDIFWLKIGPLKLIFFIQNSSSVQILKDF